MNIKEIKTGKMAKKVMFILEIEKHFTSLDKEFNLDSAEDYLLENQYFIIECLPNSDIINSIAKKNELHLISFSVLMGIDHFAILVF